uniref:RNase H type-1 domain-containing protein n=1 Tax=Setaria italica TaxID=4555 RepID=K4ALI8_SETIT
TGLEKGERGRTATGLAYIVASQSDEFLKLAMKEHKPPPERSTHWSRPIEDTLKINSDGAYNGSTSDGGWGYAIRDSSGEVIRAGAGRVPYLMDAFHAQVLACLAGIKAAGDRGTMNVEAETDSLMLKMAIEGREFSLAPAGGLIHEIKSIISNCFMQFSVVCNKAAHALAARGCKCSPIADLHWDGVPEGTENLVASDIAESLS